MNYSDTWQDVYDNLLPEDYEIPEDKTEEDEDEQDE
jgi:hypothetical protein